MTEAELRVYAQLALRVGVNLQRGQLLVVDCVVEHAPLVRALAAEAYAAGASYVDAAYGDPYVRRSQIELAPAETLSWSPPWSLKRLQHVADNGGALLGIFGDPDPTLLVDLDDKRVAAARMEEASAVYQRIVAGAAAWSVVAFPTPRWAGLVFGDPDVEQLWKAIAYTVRLDEPDPVAAWNEHIERLERRAERLHELDLAAVRFVGPGTDLRVRLHATSRWHTARHQSASGVLHVANMPTEEVFTTPDARGTEGVVRATYPLNMTGTTVDGLELTFHEGRVTQVRASGGEGFIREHIAIDDGAARLGEVALVDRNSRVGRSGLVFHNGLFDENAASHIALGAGWTPAVANATDLRADELHERGINQSLVHTDFMIGSPEVGIVGVTSDGDEVTLLENGEWVAR